MALPLPISHRTLQPQGLLKGQARLPILALGPMRGAEMIQESPFSRLIAHGPAEPERGLILYPRVRVGKTLFQTTRPGPVEIRQRQAERVLGLWDRRRLQ